MTLLELVTAIRSLTTTEHQEVAEALVIMDECQAERLKNAIIVAQQEEDLRFLELQKQHSMMQAAEDSYDLDCQYYGGRV